MIEPMKTAEYRVRVCAEACSPRERLLELQRSGKQVNLVNLQEEDHSCAS